MIDEIVARWSLDPESNIPLHIQLAQHIRWSISAGEVASGSLLLPIRELAQRLGVSLNTVKTAYQELQREGLLISRRGHGTTVVSPVDWTHDLPVSLEQSIEQLVRLALNRGCTFDQLQQAWNRVAERSRPGPTRLALVLVECDEDQLALLADDIRTQLGIRVEMVLVDQLETERLRLARRAGQYLGIATTYFHYREVRESLGALGFPIIGLVVTTSQETRTALSQLPSGTTVGAVCRDPESLVSMASTVQAMVVPGVQVRPCLAGDDRGLAALVKEATALVCTVPVRKIVMKQAGGKPVYALYDRLDPGSVRILSEHFALPLQAEAAPTCHISGE
ncbi:MAG TPA: GntR family transcriptional regulator [Firmicutes bacterium]|nr:GntR family transcriptional regulator [Bacillota bacterium]